MKNHAFSLIEILVVITIVGILSALAVPAYNSYILKAKISSALTILHYVNKAVLQKYDQQTIGATITIGDATLVNGVASPFTGGNVPMAVYHNSVNGIPANKVLTCVFISGLDAMKITSGASYIAATSGSRGQRSGMCIYNVLTGGVINQYCGIWSSNPGNGGDSYLPPEYLLPSCSSMLINY